MPLQSSLDTAIGGCRWVSADWMPASQVQPFILNDPAIVWLEYHGAEHGFLPDTSPYEFDDFIAEKAHQFEERWVAEMAPEAVRVCMERQDGRDARKVEQTFEFMQLGVPVIAQPILWWAPERIYGIPDFLVQTTWLRAHFEKIMGESQACKAAPHLGEGGQSGHYVVFDLKFTTKLEESRKTKDLEVYAAQIRLYSYMLGQLQGLMPEQAFLITRDRLYDPLPVDISSKVDHPLDGDLAAIRDHFVEIKTNGARYVPWQNEIVALNLDQRDDRWCTAKEDIAWKKVPGGDPSLLYRIGAKDKPQLDSLGYSNLADLLEEEPADIPLETIKGIGAKRAGQIRAILKANRSGAAVFPPSNKIPPRKPFEFYVDFEYFTNVNVNFETQWPTLEGCDMVFMIGAGWEDQGRWRFRSFVAKHESQDQELAIFEEFIEFLKTEMGGAVLDKSKAAFYHWTGAEVWQTKRIADRHGLLPDHPIWRLPWHDLQKVFLDGPAAVPGAWNYGLKAVAKALGDLDSAFDTKWPADLDVGLQAMVMGWRAYETRDPMNSKEMRLLRQYLDADCRALWQVLRWLRAGSGDRSDTG